MISFIGKSSRTRSFSMLAVLISLFLCIETSFAVEIDEQYYFYLKDYPERATPSWGDDDHGATNGIAHDDDHWFISQTTVGDHLHRTWYLWRIPVTAPLDQDFSGRVPTRSLSDFPVLDSLNFDHAGDLDYFRKDGVGYLAVPVTGDPGPAIAFFKADDLTFVTYEMLSKQFDVGWCAFDLSGNIYTSKDETTSLYKYELDWLKLKDGSHVNALKYTRAYSFKDKNGATLTLHHMQGGEFSPSNDLLYISCGIIKCLWYNDQFPEDGIHVFDASQLSSSSEIREVARSINQVRNQSGTFDYSFNNDGCGGDEPEGLTIWDLSDGRAPNVCGQLHVLLMDHAKVLTERVSLKHYAAEEAPTPFTPTNGSFCLPRVVTLKWTQNSQYGAGYYVEIDQTTNFETPEFTEIALNGSSFVMTPQLKQGTKYYWRVIRFPSECNPKATSRVFSFTTEPAIVPVTVSTDPPGLNYNVGATTYSATRTFNWTNGSSHALSVTEPLQRVTADSAYRFTRWVGDVSSTSTNVNVTPSCGGEGFTAVFEKVYWLNALSDGEIDVSPPSNWFRAGRNVLISIADTGVIPFAGWNGSGNGSYSGCLNPATITMGGPIMQRAAFNQNPATVQVALSASRPEVVITSSEDSGDSSDVFCWSPGSFYTISAPEYVMIRPQQHGGRDSVRLRFDNWSDGGDREHEIVVPGRARSYTANYAMQYRLSYKVNSAHDGGEAYPPAGWFDSGQVVNIVAVPDCGFRFDKWRGEGEGSYKGEDSSAQISILENIEQEAVFSAGDNVLRLKSDTIDGIAGSSLSEFNWIDFDDDGRPDLFAYDEVSKSGLIFANRDSGYFEVNSGASFTSTPTEMKWIDFDGDRHLDCFAIDEHTPVLFRADNSSLSRVQFSVMIDPVVGTSRWVDYDKDGDLDYFAEFNQTPRLFENNSSVFSELSSFWQDSGSVSNLDWIDVDNDKDLDLFYVRGNVPLLLLNGGSLFTRKVVSSDSAEKLVNPQWVDFDADGDLDFFAIVGRDANVLRNDSLKFSEVVMPWSHWPNSESLTHAQWVDFDGDGKRDFFGVRQRGDDHAIVEFYGSNGSGYTQHSFSVQNYSSDQVLSWEDFDCDGDLDLSQVDSTSKKLELYENKAGTMVEPPTIFSLQDFESTVQWSNLDLEGNLDFFTYANGRAIIRSIATCKQMESSITLIPTSTHASSNVATLIIESEGNISRRVVTNYSNLNRLEVCELGMKGASSSVTVDWASGKSQMLANLPPFSHATVFEGQDVPTDVEDTSSVALPRTFTLFQNYPNPFNPETSIGFSLPETSRVRLSIFNLLGQEVKLLANASYIAGKYLLKWDGNDNSGNRLSSGMYFYRLQTENYSEAKKMIFLK